MKVFYPMIAGLLWAVSNSASAALTSTTTTIAYIESYTTFGGGDVVFATNTKAAGCDGGFWLKKTDDGFNANLSMLMAAFHAKSNILAYGYDDQVWTGSITKFCHLYLIRSLN